MKRYWEAHFLILECSLSLILACVFFILSALVNKNIVVAQILDGNRTIIYSTLASIYGSLLGFLITTVSILIGYSKSERLTLLTKSEHYGDLWKTFISTIKGLAFAVLLSIAGLIFDIDAKPVWPIFYVNSWLALFLSFRMGRSIWIFENIMEIMMKKKDQN